MKIKYKIIIILSLLLFITLGSSLTYSFFHSASELNANDKKIAKFIFKTNQLDNIELPLVDLKPGFHETYPFSVTNTDNSKKSDVAIEYQLTIETFHLVPLSIKLYSTDIKGDNLLLNCTDAYTRDPDTNEVICNTDYITLDQTKEDLKNYKLEVEFPNNFSDSKFSNLVDYVNIDIKSKQKLGG